MRTLQTVASALALMVGTPAFAQPVFPEPPSAEVQRRIKGEVIELLGDRLSFATPDEARASIELLRTLAAESADRPDAQYVMLALAMEKAIELQDARLAGVMIDALRAGHAINPLEMRSDALAAILERIGTDRATDEQGIRAAIDWLGSIAAEAIEFGRLDLALAALERGQAIAAQGFAEQIRFVVAGVAGDAEPDALAEKARHAALTLLQEPSDPVANRVAGEYLCFALGDWAHGLPHLARGDHAVLRALAAEELQTAIRPERLVEIARCWRAIAAIAQGRREGHALAHAESILRRAYPETAGLTRLQLDREMLSRPLLIFDGDRPPDAAFIEEHFQFRANHGREGPGSWANYGVEHGKGMLVANRAGYVETREHFPPESSAAESAQHYQIEAELWSDLLMGTALEFAGQRMYFGHAPGGIHLEGGWVAPVIQPITSDRYHHYVIDISPTSIAFTIDGVRVGELPVEGVAPGPVVLRGWEGHVRCRRLALWAIPAEALPPVEPPGTDDGASPASGFQSAGGDSRFDSFEMSSPSTADR